MPVTTPVELTVALVAALLLHVPPEPVSVSVTGVELQTELDPVMVAGGVLIMTFAIL